MSSPDGLTRARKEVGPDARIVGSDHRAERAIGPAFADGPDGLRPESYPSCPAGLSERTRGAQPASTSNQTPLSPSIEKPQWSASVSTTNKP